MAKNTQHALQQINDVSRQLLSRIRSVQNKALENTVMIDKSSSEESIDNSLLTKNVLTQLMSERERLIESLFNENTHSEITLELTLLNEMVSLDSELTSKSKACKQVLSEQVIRLKKGKKASKSYQKY